MKNVTTKKLRDVVKKKPGDARAWFALGQAALECGEIEDGKQALRQAGEVSAYDPDLSISAANLFVQAGFLSDAEALLRHVVEQHPTELEGRSGLARLLLETGRSSDATREIAVALRLSPNNIDLRLLAAEISERTHALAAAADHLAVVLATQPAHVEGNRRLAQILLNVGDVPGSIRCLRRVVGATRGEDFDLLTLLGQALSSNGQHAEAVQMLTDIAHRMPKFSPAFANLGMALVAAARIEEGVEVLLRALELDPRSAQAHCGLGIAYQKLGKWDEAVEAFRATEQLAPDNAVGSLNLGLALDAVGDKDGARRALLRAAAVAPEDEEISRALEEFLLKTTTSAVASTPGTPAASSPSPVPPPASVLSTGEIQALAPHSLHFEASIKGDLKSFQLFDVLEFLRLQNKTGSLVISAPTGAGIVRMVGGAVAWASAPGLRRLGETLVDAGVISKGNLEFALGRQREAEAHGHNQRAQNFDPLGLVLLRERLVTRERLSTFVLKRIMDALAQMISWPAGAFSFHDADGSESPPISFNLQEVMLDLMRVIDEQNNPNASPS